MRFYNFVVGYTEDPSSVNEIFERSVFEID